MPLEKVLDGYFSITTGYSNAHSCSLRGEECEVTAVCNVVFQAAVNNYSC